MRLSGQFQACLFVVFFYEKIFSTKKDVTSKNQPAKTKTSKQKTKTTIFCAQKLLRK